MPAPSPILKIARRPDCDGFVRTDAETYPHECCGALLGKDGDDDARGAGSVPLINRRDDSPRNRFSITAGDFRAGRARREEAGLELVGWYHSHPDHPARPSEFDREHAWPWYSYVIVSVANGEAEDDDVLAAEDDRTRFGPEKIVDTVFSGVERGG